MKKLISGGLGCLAMIALGAGSGYPLQAQRPTAIITHITGTAFDAVTGRVMRGVTVAVVLRGSQLVTAVTDSSGRFRIEDELRTGGTDETVRAYAVGYFPETLRIQLGCSEVVSHLGERGVCRKEVNFYLQGADRLFEQSAPECVLQGRAVDERGATFAGAQIELRGSRSGVITDEAGKFSINGVKAGIGVITARAIGRFNHEKVVLVACSTEGQAAPVVFQLMPQVIW